MPFQATRKPSRRKRIAPASDGPQRLGSLVGILDRGFGPVSLHEVLRGPLHHIASTTWGLSARRFRLRLHRVMWEVCPLQAWFISCFSSHTPKKKRMSDDQARTRLAEMTYHYHVLWPGISHKATSWPSCIQNGRASKQSAPLDQSRRHGSLHIK